MSSSNHNPFEDITNGKEQDPKELKRQRGREYYARNREKILSRQRQSRELKKQSLPTMNDENTPDPKEVKRQRNREYYAKNKDEVLKRTRQSRELKKKSSAPADDENILCDAGATGQTGVTQLQCITPVRGVNGVEVFQASAPSWRTSQRTPLSNVTNKHINDTLGIGDIGSACSSMSMDFHTPCVKSTMQTDLDTDCLHRNDTYMRDIRILEEMRNVPTSLGLHDQDSFIAKSTYEEKKRQRDSSEETRQLKRERYSLMTNEQKNIRLHKNREYRKCIRQNRTISACDGLVTASDCTPIGQAQPYKNHPTGDINNDEDSDPTGIFESNEHEACLDGKVD